MEEKEQEKFDRRGKSRNINKLRNLPQYKNKTDEEIELIVAKKEVGAETSRAFELRIEEKLAKFEEDYDLTDLKVNDKEVLRGLVQAIISLEDYEQYVFKLRSDGVSPENLLVIDKIERAMNDKRKSISDAQNDLAITRKHRKSDQETSVIAYIEGLKEKARKFYQARMSYIFCPKCNTLLSTAWFLFPDSENIITLTCKQKDKNDKPCGTKVKVTSKQLLDRRGTNNKENMPDSML